MKSKTYCNLIYYCQDAPDMHPEDVMKELGIDYLWAEAHPIGDQWWFVGCENLPEQLPTYLEVYEGFLS